MAETHEDIKNRVRKKLMTAQLNLGSAIKDCFEVLLEDKIPPCFPNIGELPNGDVIIHPNHPEQKVILAENAELGKRIAELEAKLLSANNTIDDERRVFASYVRDRCAESKVEIQKNHRLSNEKDEAINILKGIMDGWGPQPVSKLGWSCVEERSLISARVFLGSPAR